MCYLMFCINNDYMNSSRSNMLRNTNDIVCWRNKVQHTVNNFTNMKFNCNRLHRCQWVWTSPHRPHTHTHTQQCVSVYVLWIIFTFTFCCCCCCVTCSLHICISIWRKWVLFCCKTEKSVVAFFVECKIALIAVKMLMLVCGKIPLKLKLKSAP